VQKRAETCSYSATSGATLFSTATSAATATASAASAAAASACCKGREYNNYRTGKWFKRSTAAAAQANTVFTFSMSDVALTASACCRVLRVESIIITVLENGLKAHSGGSSGKYAYLLFPCD
jgi:hypothetical protein